MATFTIPLKRVIELTDGHIGLDNYPIFDADYREPLNSKIIDHYYNQEIGMETVDMFQLAMRRRMNEVMPYYNMLYLSEKVQYDPLSTIDIKTVTNAESEQLQSTQANNSSLSNNKSESRSVSHDFPQTALAGNGDYATGAADVTSGADVESTAEEQSTANASTDQRSESTVSGYQGVASELIMRYRQSLINIDLMVIEELRDCFMLIWNNGDSYTNTRGYLY